MIIIVMGVSGCGKSTIAEELSKLYGIPYYDGDKYHSETNRQKMAKDIPLTDEDRYPWLQEIARHMEKWQEEGDSVLACSALKEKYRRILTEGNGPVIFVHLVGPKALLKRRLEERKGSHPFIRDYDEILDGQFRDLEPPKDAIEVPIDLSVEEIIERVRGELLTRGYDKK